MSQYFTDHELRCRCGCGQNRMDPDFMALVDYVRGELGYPLFVTSAYRCPKYNNQVAKSGLTGPHTTGRAIDILAYGYKTSDILRQALKLNFRGIGIYQTGPHESRFIHLDTVERGVAYPVIWNG